MVGGPPIDPANVAGSRSLVVLAALRAYLADRLGLPERLVGGWELLAARRDATLAVYTNGGEDFIRAGSVTGGTEELTASLVTRSGSSPLHEELMFPVRDALRELLFRFTHPALAGVHLGGWTFDIQQDNGFTNILTVKATLSYRSAPAQFQRVSTHDTNLGVVKSVIASILQVPHTEAHP